jgi:hypothetical protein
MPHPLEIICASRTHCGTCRDREGGRAWRASLAAHYVVPGGAADFACPHGVEWGTAAAPLSPDADGAIPPQPIPRDRWPLSVRIVAKRAEPGEGGVGDTFKRMLGEGGELFKRLTKRIGIDCGCAARQAHLNAIYPYE